MKACKIFAFLAAFAYNLYLLYIIQHNKINVKFHEESVQKKEVEFVYGINNIWVNEQYYTFSSFRSGIINMYHRIFANMYVLLMMAVNASGKTGNESER